jgi:hypothetical protein
MNIHNFKVWNTINILQNSIINHIYTKKIHLQSKRTVFNYFLNATFNFVFLFLHVVRLDRQIILEIQKYAVQVP